MTAALLGFLVVFALAFLRVPLAVAMTIAGLGGLA
jgi:C4-dicarboxylate transporter, DctM subunit